MPELPPATVERQEPTVAQAPEVPDVAASVLPVRPAMQPLMKRFYRLPPHLPREIDCATVPMPSWTLLSADIIEREFDRTVCGVYHGALTGSVTLRRVDRTNV